MAVAKKSQASSSSAQAASKKVTVDFSAPANDSVFDGDAYVQYLKERIKVEGKAGNLSDKVTVTKEGDGKVVIASSTANGISSRYIKYLSKKFLRKQNMRDWLRVVSNGKRTFTLKYFNVNTAEEADADQD